MSAFDLFLMRMRGILRKEMLQIRRDPSSIALALVMPVVLLFIFGYGVSLDAENVPVAIVLEDSTAAARDLAARFDLSPYFAPVHTKSIDQAQAWLGQHRVDAIVHLKSDFSRNLATRTRTACGSVPRPAPCAIGRRRRRLARTAGHPPDPADCA